MYKDYVESVFHATSLDRNQIIRLALFLAAHSHDYKNILKKYQNADVTLPHPKWEWFEDDCWKDQNYTAKEKNPLNNDKKIIDQGGIVIKIG